MPGSRPHGGTPQRDPKRFVPSRGFLGDQGFRRASQAPCAAAPCAGMFSQSRRAAESRIITGNVPGGERAAAGAGGTCTVRARGSLHPRTGASPSGPPFPCQPGPTHPSGSCRASPGRRCRGTAHPPRDSGQGHVLWGVGVFPLPQCLGEPQNPGAPPGNPGHRQLEGSTGSLGCRALVPLPGIWQGYRRPSLLRDELGGFPGAGTSVPCSFSSWLGARVALGTWHPQNLPAGAPAEPHGATGAGLAPAGSATQICHQACPGTALPQPPRQPGAGPGWDVDARHVPQRAQRGDSRGPSGGGQPCRGLYHAQAPCDAGTGGHRRRCHVG